MRTNDAAWTHADHDRQLRLLIRHLRRLRHQCWVGGQHTQDAALLHGYAQAATWMENAQAWASLAYLDNGHGDADGDGDGEDPAPDTDGVADAAP